MSSLSLAGEFDAAVWAEKWLETIKKHPEIPTDEGTMIGWFANAIMAGYDKAKSEEEELWGLLEKEKYTLIYDEGMKFWLVVVMGEGGVVSRVVSRGSRGISPREATIDAKEQES